MLVVGLLGVDHRVHHRRAHTRIMKKKKRGHNKRAPVLSNEHWNCHDCARTNTDLEVNCVWCGSKRRRRK